jgi:magnesium-transporting ATPase (P-type)
MQVTGVWTAVGAANHGGNDRSTGEPSPEVVEIERIMAVAASRCCTAELNDMTASGDPTEVALLAWARSLGVHNDAGERDRAREALYRFDPVRRLMTTVDASADGRWVHTKGASEAVLSRCDGIAAADEQSRPLTDFDRRILAGVLEDYGGRGLRVLAIARRQLEAGTPLTACRDEVEQGLCLMGLVALLDPPRPEVGAAIARAHQAGLRINVVTGDNGSTATEIARQVGIGTGAAGHVTVNDEELNALSDAELEHLLASGPEIIFARSSPEAKLRIADALRSRGQVVAMTGDGVNDAPALRTADIGVAMGRSGTEVAREAGTMILTDDNFATIVDAIEQGRRVYDNVRKFILYIFTHAVPEVAPFVVFALAGGAIPLPLTVMEILAIDLGTDTLPALALSREKAEPGIMDRPPRPPKERVIRRSLLVRAWGFLGVISAVLVLGGYLLTLHLGGWSPHAPTGPGTPLHHVYRQATTVAWLGIVACQVGTAFAARTERVSLRRVGFASNRLLLGAIAIALLFAALVVYAPLAHSIFGTAALSARQVATVAPFPFVVWGADELRRWVLRRRGRPPAPGRDLAEAPSFMALQGRPDPQREPIRVYQGP